MRSRIEDVAAAAGVSMKTVSRVLNNEPNVLDEMRQRVMAVVEKLQGAHDISFFLLPRPPSCSGLSRA